jgi:hypothetical protein
MSKQIKKYQRAWYYIECFEANKIGGLGRFHNVFETLPYPPISFSHAENRGSIPLGTTSKLKGLAEPG